MHNTTAKDIMNRHIFSVPADWTLQRLAKFLTEKGISGAPVVDDGRLVGVVSQSDIAWYESLRGEEEEGMPGGSTPVFYRLGSDRPLSTEEVLKLTGRSSDEEVTVTEIMNPTIYDVDEETPLKDVGQLMVENHLHRVFVTREGELVGLIAALDLVRHMVEEPASA